MQGELSLLFVCCGVVLVCVVAFTIVFRWCLRCTAVFLRFVVGCVVLTLGNDMFCYAMLKYITDVCVRM